METLFVVVMIFLHIFTIISMVGIASAISEGVSDLFGFFSIVSLILLSLVIGGWSIVGWQAQYDYKSRTEEFTSTTVGDVDVIVDEDKIINLNDRFGRDIEEGAVIVKTYYDKDLGWFRGQSGPTYEIKEEK